MNPFSDEHKWSIGYNGTYEALWSIIAVSKEWATVLYDCRNKFDEYHMQRWQSIVMPELERHLKRLNDEFVRLSNPPIDKQSEV